MLAVVSAIALSAATIAVLAAVMALAERVVPTTSTDDLVDAIDDILPQTQCAQCGYPGCRPYAEAVLAGAPINLCPPGGERAVAALAELLGRSAEPLVARVPAQVVARIDPAACIGCTLCLPACPVDAIVGANGYLHGVLEADCTGCELCIAPCPVDCITLLPLASAASGGSATP